MKDHPLPSLPPSHPPAHVLQRLYVPEARERVQQLYPHGAQHGTPVEEEEVPARPRVFHGVLDELNDGLGLELGHPTEAEVA